jgi:Uma2 family endonuclease
MARPAPVEPGSPIRLTVDQYFALVRAGTISSDDRVELLAGVVVAMSPSNPPHAAAVHRVFRALLRAVGDRATVRCQSSLVLASHSVPEPDVAVCPGGDAAYDDSHPTTALLVVEVADSSLVQDRVTKSALYAAAAIPEYWIVNVRENRVEIRRAPRPESARYTEIRVHEGGETVELAALPGVTVALGDLLPQLVRPTA